MLSSFLIKPIFLSIAPREAEIEAAAEKKNFPYRWSDEVIYKTNKLTKTIYDLSILQYFASNSCLFFPILKTRKNVDPEKIFKSNQIIISWIYNKMLSRDILKLILTIWDDNSFLCDKKNLETIMPCKSVFIK